MVRNLFSDLAEFALEYAQQKGAQQVSVKLSRVDFIELRRRARKVEVLQSSTSQSIALSLFVDDRYSNNTTSFLQKDPLEKFIDESLCMTRLLSPDPCRALADPDLYGPTVGVELDLHDRGYEALTMDQRQAVLKEVEAAAYQVDPAIVSVAAEMSTQESEYLQIHSNGFRGERRSSSFSVGSEVTVLDGDRRPEDSWWVSVRHLEDLPKLEQIGQEAARRAVSRIGACKKASDRMTLVLENREATRMIGSLLEPLRGAALQQRRSCFEGMLKKAVGSTLLNLRDEPLLKRGLGSRTFDSDGLAAKPLNLMDSGVLENFLVDVYYARKLGVDPSTGSTSNLVLEPGSRSLRDLISGIEKGILVTSFLGGNSNPATGDFSFGISGLSIKGGNLERPVNEMNIADNHCNFWQKLIAVADDPFLFSSWRIPSLVFADVQFSGN
ncbi:MAG: TldD/PmbA family protein [Pseudomonadota bacterium]